MIPLRSVPKQNLLALSQYTGARLESLRAYRTTWWAHWGQLAEYFLPRRYRYFVTPNNYARGSQINQAIIDETGMLAARVLQTGLLSGLTSPDKPWFRYGIEGYDDEDAESAANIWLNQCTDIVLDVYANSNFYQTLGQAYGDNTVFGSAALIQYEHDEKVVWFKNPPLGEFMFALGADLTVDTLYYEFTITVSEAVKTFGKENLTPDVQSQCTNASGLDTEIVFCCAIEPNKPFYQSGVEYPSPVPRAFSYRQVHWQKGGGNGAQGIPNGAICQIDGYREKPFSGLRWDVTANDAYGRSPGMDALPAVKQLTVEQRRKGEAIDKMVRPPMVASISMKNEPADTLPGGVTYTADPQAGFKPAFQVDPRISELTKDISEVQQRIFRVFFNDLFLGITQLGTVRTATEIEARKAEILVQIGPVIERTQSEGLNEQVLRTFSICNRRGLFPPPPPEIAGMPLKVKYVSMLAEVQRAASTAAIERFFAFVGGLAAVKPEVLDVPDFDEGVKEYGERMNVNPKLIKSIKRIAEERGVRAQQQQTAQALEAAPVITDGAKTLSETEVGGGINALQLMLGQA